MTTTRKTPWANFEVRRGYAHLNNNSISSWDAANWPFVVRWSVPYNDGSFATRFSKSTQHIREFKTLEEATAAFNLGFTGLSVDLQKYNGGAPGSHMDRLAYRKCGKSTKWYKGA